MADINVLYARRDSIINQLTILRARADGRRKEIERTEASLSQGQATQPRIERALARAEASGNTAAAAQARSDLVANQNDITTLQSVLSREQANLAQTELLIAQLEADLAAVNQQINAAQQSAAAPRQSAGETVANSQTARAEGSSSTNPPPVAQTLDANEQVVDIRDLPASNAQRTPAGVAAQDLGTNGRLRKSNETQATPANTANPGAPPPTPSGPRPSATPGVAAPGDDVRASINTIFGSTSENARIITQANVLDRYASYSYSISIYLMSPQDYARLVRTKQKNLAGYNLLIQSAGIPVSTGFGSVPGVADVGEVPGVTSFSRDAGRNEFFQEDFYIDDLRVKSVISGKGTAGPHNVTTLDFRIVEPNGITLLPRLFKAVQQYAAGQGASKEQNYAAQNYLMVIKFYGYDVDGNQYLPVKGSRNNENGEPETTPQAIEKFIPFQFSSIKFRVADKITEYQCEAVCPQNLIATGPARGVIPYNVEITSKTLKDLFSGPVAFSSPPRTGTVDPNQSAAETQRLAQRAAAAAPTTSAPQGLGNTFDLEQGITPNFDRNAVGTSNSAPPKASAASTPTITQGLAQALNRYQEELVAKGVYTIPDTYYIQILTPALQNAKVVPPGQTNQRTVPMGPGSKAPANQQKNPATQSQNKDAKTTSALAGMSVLQFIDQYTRTSTYIYDQQIRIIDPKTGRPIDVGTPAEVTAWYRVGLEAVPKTTAGYDPKRNDYAYDITYQISPYKVNDVQSDFFPPPKFQGTHKKYNYWFTGENTQILRFEQDFNYLYYLTINTQQTQDQLNVTSDYREYLKKAFSPRSAQSAQGQQGATNEPSANAADYLYSPADQGRVRLEIVGDPAWLQQGELWAGVAGAGQAYGPFLEDGTINYEGQEALFEIAFNQPVDYNLDTGVMDPTTNNYNKTQTSAGSARQSYVYRAVDVTSVFSQGRFTQELNGVLIFFDLPRQQQAQTESNIKDVSVLPNQSDAETRRLQASAASAAPTFLDKQLAAANVVSAARREQLGQLVSNPLGTIFGVAPSNNPLSTGSLETEGFIAPAQPPQPPTSSGQPVGTASTPTSIFGQYGALGAGTGSPAVTFTTSTGRVVTARSAEDISSAFNAGFINRVVANELTRQLSDLQQQANSPRSNQPAQNIARES